MGLSNGNTGTLSISGSGDLTANRIYVGFGGSGTLNITGGGKLASFENFIANNSTSTSSALVSGAGSSWAGSSFLNVGHSGTGSLTLEGGATMSMTGNVALGKNSGGIGTANISGTGTSLTSASYFAAGETGRGTLNLSSGATISNTIGYVGLRHHQRQQRRDHYRHRLPCTNSGDMFVGRTAAATLNIENGGKVKNANGFVSGLSTGNGFVTVTGSGSIWENTGGLYRRRCPARAGSMSSAEERDQYYLHRRSFRRINRDTQRRRGPTPHGSAAPLRKSAGRAAAI